jgi:hypothetical protein
VDQVGFISKIKQAILWLSFYMDSEFLEDCLCDSKVATDIITHIHTKCLYSRLNIAYLGRPKVDQPIWQLKIPKYCADCMIILSWILGKYIANVWGGWNWLTTLCNCGVHAISGVENSGYAARRSLIFVDILRRKRQTVCSRNILNLTTRKEVN